MDYLNILLTNPFETRQNKKSKSQNKTTVYFKHKPEIKDFDSKVSSQIAHSYVNAQISLQSKLKSYETVDEFYNKNIWILGKEFTTKKKQIEPPKIKTEEEYNKLIENISNQKIKDIKEKVFYPNVPDKYVGLIPYCGVYDSSQDINKYLSGRQIKDIHHYNNGELNKYCAVLDYSLRQLDKDFGKYEGMVYRLGFFDPNVHQYFSTSKESNIPKYAVLIKKLIKQSKDSIDTHNTDIHIIKTKSGHKIHDFQQQYLEPDDKNKIIYNSLYQQYENIREFFLKEKEILLSTENEFKEAENNSQLDEEKIYLAKKLLPYFQGQHIKDWETLEEILSHIKIWEEV